MSETRRSWEFSAIPLTVVILGILGVILWAFSAGLWVWVGLGIVILVGLVAFALVYMARPHHPAALDAPVPPDGGSRHDGDGVHRVLVIADDACTPADLAPAIAGPTTEAFVVAPPLGSRIARWTSDERAYVEAADHLRTTLAALADLGVKAEGRAGSHDPLQAADDGLREFPADEIVFAVHPSKHANWLERGVVESARARYAIPVKELTIARS